MMTSKPLELLMSKTKAKSDIQKRIDIGNNYYNKTISGEQDYEKFRREIKNYNNYNFLMLKKMFNNESNAKKYRMTYCHMTADTGNETWEFWLKEEKENLAEKINELESIQEQLELIPSKEKISSEKNTQSINANNKKIFIVHGQDNEAKERVARFIEKFDLEPIILHEQANEGTTIIEKFEKHSADVGFAVILLTADDKGFAKNNPDNSFYRARQNVILELGYFIGKLGRSRVCALCEPNVEIPSDINGLLYIPYDEKNDWKISLAKEIKESGIKIDLNKIV